MWKLDCKESWTLKNWCFWTVVLEKTLESPLDCKEIQPVHSEGNQSWIHIGRTDAEAETPILWPPDVKNWLIWKTLMLEWLKAGREGDNRGWDGWMESLIQWRWVWVIPAVGDGQGGLACSGPLHQEQLDMTEQLNWTELNWPFKQVSEQLSLPSDTQELSMGPYLIELVSLSWSHNWNP